jgi:NADPH:quinone reductase-like Zn-dependent oxidoreductase
MVLRELIESGAIAPAIDRSFPLAQAAAAIRYLLDGRAQGKIVIAI